MMRLLTLPEPLKQLVDNGALSAGHARALLAAAEPEALARKVIAQGLNVRQTEQLVNSTRAGRDKRKRTEVKDADTLALERDLGNALGLAVEIRFRGSRGSLVLHYTSLDQLDDILHRLSRGTHGRPADTNRADHAGAE
jgi:ParB family chromosome partitioning protein